LGDDDACRLAVQQVGNVRRGGNRLGAGRVDLGDGVPDRAPFDWLGGAGDYYFAEL